MMRDVNSKGISFWGQLGTLIGLTGGGVIAGSVLSYLIWMMMTGHALPLNADEILQPKYYKEDMVIQVISTFFIFFLPAYFFALICYRRPLNFLGFNFRINYKQVLLVILILVATFPLAGALAELNKVLPISQHLKDYFKKQETAREIQEAALIQLHTLPQYLVSLIVIAFLPALFEETYFRAGLQNLLIRWLKGPWVAIILTAIIFSLIHLSYYGFIVRFALGILLGAVYYYSGSLWLNVLFHFLFNGVQVTALYFAGTKRDVAHADIETAFPWWLGVVALAATVYLVNKFIEVSRKKLAAYPSEEVPRDDFENWVGEIS